MGKAIEEMVARDIITEEVGCILWKYGLILPEEDLERCLRIALKNHKASLADFAIEVQK